MDDFVLNVRQIGQYPLIDIPADDDLVLIQQGGLGGPYGATNTLGVVLGGMSGVGATITCQGPFIATELQIAGTTLVWNSTPNGAINFTPGGGFTLGYIIPGQGFSYTLANFNADGVLNLPNGTVLAGRDPVQEMEVATRRWVQNNTVWSFNGRIGIVNLTGADINSALGVAPGDSLLTLATANDLICRSLQQFYSYSPLVFTFNGRVGDVTLTLDDINQANFSVPGSYPQAPSPGLGDASNNIATTMFVDQSIEDASSIINTAWSAADNAIIGMLGNYAPINSPIFTGIPSAPTPATTSNDGTLATTAYVTAKIQAATTGVASWNGRTGAVVLQAADLSAVGGALLTSPIFVGTPTAPTAPPGNSSQQLATTAFVTAAITSIGTGVTSFNTRTGAVTLTAADITNAGGAILNSPAFSGTPTAPTATAGTNTTQIATTAFVLANAGVLTFNGRTGAVSLQSTDVSGAGGALLASPAFTGTPTAPTATAGTNNTQIATTAFVTAAMGVGAVTSFNTRTGAVQLLLADITNAGGAPINSPTFTGTTTFPPVESVIISGTAAQKRDICGMTGTSLRWGVVLGSGNTTESGGNAGSHFWIDRYSDAGAYIDTPFSINRSTGQVATSAALIVGTGFGVTGASTLTGAVTMNSTLNVSGTSTLGTVNCGAINTGGYNINTTGNVYCTNVQASNAVIGQTYVQAGGQGVYYTATNCYYKFGNDGYGVQCWYNNTNLNYLIQSYGQSGNASIYQLWVGSNGAYCGVFWPGGSATFPITPSDRRLKSHLKEPGDALETANAIHVYDLDMESPVDHQLTHHSYSIIADELPPVLPEAYIPPPSDEGVAGIHPTPLISMLIKAVQQLDARVKVLEGATA